MEVQDYSDESDEVVDYDGVDETYDDDSKEDDSKEDDSKEDDPDLKGKEKEIEMIIESDDENSVASSFY